MIDTPTNPISRHLINANEFDDLIDNRSTLHYSEQETLHYYARTPAQPLIIYSKISEHPQSKTVLTKAKWVQRIVWMMCGIILCAIGGIFLKDAVSHQSPTLFILSAILGGISLWLMSKSVRFSIDFLGKKSKKISGISGLLSGISLIVVGIISSSLILMTLSMIIMICGTYLCFI